MEFVERHLPVWKSLNTSMNAWYRGRSAPQTSLTFPINTSADSNPVAILEVRGYNRAVLMCECDGWEGRKLELDGRVQTSRLAVH